MMLEHASQAKGVLTPFMRLLAHLEPYLVPRVTTVRLSFYAGPGWTLLRSGDPGLADLGITLTGEPAIVAVRSTERKLGAVHVQCAQPGLLLVFDNEDWAGSLLLNFRAAGANCLAVFHLRGADDIVLQNVLLRGSKQILFWGCGSTAVQCQIIEVNGEGQGIIVGDDALVSNGITIRNHDMHAVVDTLTWAAVNPPVTTVIERHVWIGQDVLLLACERVGYGSILAARSVIKGTIPPKVAAGGTPARVLHMDRSWGRDSFAPSAKEIAQLRMLDGLAAGNTPGSSLTIPSPDFSKLAGNFSGATPVMQSAPDDGIILATEGEASATADLAASDAEVIRTSRLFDPAFYQQQLDERSLQAGPDSILHYVETGEALGLLPHLLFDPAYYRAASGGACLDGPALAHFIREGSRIGLRTHPLFDAGYYNTHNPDIPQAGMNALFHYLNFGGLEGRRPHPLFHSWLYIQGAPRLRDTKEDPLSHYLRGGWREGRNPHPLFDTAYYLARYPDVAAAGVNPLVHFVIAGLAEGRRPNPLFSPEAFRLSGADQPRLTEAGVAAMDAACRTQRMPAEDHAVLQAEVARRRGRTAVAGSLPGNIGIVPEEAGKEGGSGTRVIAFYLPQFHPIPENDQNWGEGFTEWTNVRRAKPNFPGHDQPRQPGELGYYDLRDADVMEQQAALAREHSVHGFCYYWYWFNGRKPLAMPLERMRDTGSPGLPFCLCWANETWTRKWVGGQEVILNHVHSDGDDALHAAELARYMMDPRYIKVAGAPLFLIYRADTMPDLPGYPNRLRAALRRAGVDSVHLALVESGVFAWAGRDPRPLGFDSAVEFPPHGGNGMLPPLPDMLNPSFSGAIFDYRQTVLRYAGAPLPPYPRWRTVMAAWDNTPRYQDNPAIFMNATPGGYRAWLEGAVRDVQASWPPGERLVFVNAWNEWGEGTVLEPDVRWGRAYLEATRDALADAGEAVRQEVGDGGHG